MEAPESPYSMRRLLTLSLVLGLLTACSSEPSTVSGHPDEQSPMPTASAVPSPTDSGEPAPAEGDTTTVELWYSISTDTPDQVGLFPVYRAIPSVPGIAAATLRAWLEGPTAEEKEAGIQDPIPAGTELLDVTIDDGTAIVDLTSDFERTGSGTFGETMLLAELAWTITQFPTVDQALLKIDGRFKDAYMGHGFVIDADHPLKRRRKDPVAPIIVSEPSFGARFSSGDLVAGTANVFEATVSLRLLGEDGGVLFEGFTTATCGTGCRGDYLEPFDFEIDSEQPGTIEVFESSAEDGSEINKVRVPVVLVP